MVNASGYDISVLHTVLQRIDSAQVPTGNLQLFRAGRGTFV